MKQPKQNKKELSLTKIYIIIFIAIFVISIIALIIDSIYKTNLTNQDLPITKPNLIPYTFGTIIFIWLIGLPFVIWKQNKTKKQNSKNQEQKDIY
ncbi:hypothetical protein [Mycoplasma crocodyli]|uniref:Uncharacterized protein n=1 Tax=Mycoplasma crocodyli (strain ATCC 51981 / MP145) TaxID=512564 RepID=D5E5P5_MYCCM|nr:hypothetical protein [Mycoplasma crocodyli]ADE19640.1 hypothetical protein MCRO_0462 [Mycoplasma crocodyli MP145]